jgi:glycosyltransferase involved in cell wall biosynthesis
MVIPQRAVIPRLRAVWHFAKRIGPLHSGEVQALARSIAASDALVVETAAAKVALDRTLGASGYSALSGRITVRWNPVQAVFSRHSVPEERERLIVASARWDDSQKDAKLLRAAFRHVLERDPEVRIEIFGRGGQVFHSLESWRLRIHGVVPYEELPRALDRARIVVFASRWEGLPMAALEGLACGCSVVGTTIPAFHAIESAGGGRAVSRRQRALATAMLTELDLWDTGQRSASALSRAWRLRVDRRRVAEAYEEVFAAVERRSDRDA